MLLLRSTVWCLVEDEGNLAYAAPPLGGPPPPLPRPRPLLPVPLLGGGTPPPPPPWVLPPAGEGTAAAASVSRGLFTTTGDRLSMAGTVMGLLALAGDAASSLLAILILSSRFFPPTPLSAASKFREPSPRIGRPRRVVAPRWCTSSWCLCLLLLLISHGTGSLWWARCRCNLNRRNRCRRTWYNCCLLRSLALLWGFFSRFRLFFLFSFRWLLNRADGDLSFLLLGEALLSFCFEGFEEGCGLGLGCLLRRCHYERLVRVRMRSEYEAHRVGRR